MLLDHKTVIDNTITQLKKFNLDKLSDFVDHIINKNPHDYVTHKNKHTMWNEQCSVNFPVLYIASICLYIYSIKKHCNTFLFASRDCCQFYKVFKALFPDAKSYYFNCSRNMFEMAIAKRNKHFKKYVNSIVKNPQETIFIDIHGTGQRMISYFEKEYHSVPYCFLLSTRYSNYEKFPSSVQKYIRTSRLVTLVFSAHGSPIEMLNYDTIGTLQSYNEKGPVRDKPEYDVNLIQPYHDCMEYIVDHVKPLDSVDLVEKYDIETLQKLIQKLFKCILSDLPIIAKEFHHIGRHAKTSGTTIIVRVSKVPTRTGIKTQRQTIKRSGRPLKLIRHIKTAPVK
jgi:hypothetical protein